MREASESENQQGLRPKGLCRATKLLGSSHDTGCQTVLGATQENGQFSHEKRNFTAITDSSLNVILNNRCILATEEQFNLSNFFRGDFSEF